MEKWKKAQVGRTEDRARERASQVVEPTIQGWARKGVPALVNFDPTVAHHFCHNLPETVSQSRDHFLAQLCSKEGGGKEGSLPSHLLPTGTAQTDERRWMGKYVN